jgi:hypothetical protein
MLPVYDPILFLFLFLFLFLLLPHEVYALQVTRHKKGSDVAVRARGGEGRGGERLLS